MQQGADLVGAGYLTTNPLISLLGGSAQSSQANLAPRTNLLWTGLSTLTDGALAATGVACAVPIPVAVGDVITKVSIVVGGTAAGTPTHHFAAIYSGIAVPALQAQSADNTSGAVAASGVFGWTLQTPVTVTTANAPNGFVYASVVFAASTVPTAATVSIPTAVGYQWFTNGPLGFSLTHGSSLTATAPATIASPAAKAVAPIVVLT